MKTIGLVVPTPWEAKPLLAYFRTQGYALHSPERGLTHMEKGDRSIWLRLSGVGRENARRAADQLCTQQQVKLLMSAGFCGALIPELHVGDIIRDRIVTVDQPARTPAERQALTRRANAIAVDMETQAVIEAGTLRGVPIRIFRVVSDRFADDLTPLLGTDEKFSIANILRRLINPALWPLAARLRRQSQLAGHHLVRALDLWLENPN